MDISQYYSLVPDFLRPGNTASDISQLLANPEVFAYSVEWLVELSKKHNIDNIIAIETRGFIWGSALAFATKLPLHLARKPLRIPHPVFESKFTSRNRHYSLSIQQDAKIYGNVMIVDDIVVSGATHASVGELLKEHFGIPLTNQLHASIVEIKDRWKGREALLSKGYTIESLISLNN